MIRGGSPDQTIRMRDSVPAEEIVQEFNETPMMEEWKYKERD